MSHLPAVAVRTGSVLANSVEIIPASSSSSTDQALFASVVQNQSMILPEVTTISSSLSVTTPSCGEQTQVLPVKSFYRRAIGIASEQMEPRAKRARHVPSRYASIHYGCNKNPYLTDLYCSQSLYYVKCTLL